MKKFATFCCLMSLLFLPSVTFAEDIMDIAREYNADYSEVYRPKSSIVIDADTGDVLFEENPDLVRDPASISKLMTVYLVLEAMKDGKLSKDSTITATERHQAIVANNLLSNNRIVAGVTYKLSDLFPMTLVASSNVTTLMMSEMITDDPDAFIDMMNKRAQELGMKNTKWYNASGAEAASFAGQYTPQRYDNYAFNETTARDLSILAYHLVNEYPEMLEYTKNPKVTVMAGTPYQEVLEGYNHSLPGDTYGMEGVDGMKTGSSPHADYNTVATIKRDGHRLIEVLLGVSNWDDDNGEFFRHPIGNALFEKMYDTYEYKKILSKGPQTVDKQQITLDKDFYATVKKGTKPSLELKGDRLTVKNGLQMVSPSIPAGMKVTLPEKGLIEKAASGVGAVFTGSFWKTLFIDYKLIFLLPVLVIAIILVLERRNRKKRLAAKSDRIINRKEHIFPLTVETTEEGETLTEEFVEGDILESDLVEEGLELEDPAGLEEENIPTHQADEETSEASQETISSEDAQAQESENGSLRSEIYLGEAASELDRVEAIEEMEDAAGSVDLSQESVDDASPVTEEDQADQEELEEDKRPTVRSTITLEALRRERQRDNQERFNLQMGREDSDDHE